VRMPDSLRVAENQAGHEQPTVPQGPAGPPCGVTGPLRDDPARSGGRDDDQHQQRERQQPGDLAADLIAEHAGDAGIATEQATETATRVPRGLHGTGDSGTTKGTVGGTTEGTTAAPAFAEDPAETVVTEDEIPCGAIGT